MRLRSCFSRVVAQTRSWVRAVVRRRRLETEMEAELASPSGEPDGGFDAGGVVAGGGGAAGADCAGTALMHKEEMRASLGLRWWDELACRSAYGMRILRKSPGFTVIAAASLASGDWREH